MPLPAGLLPTLGSIGSSLIGGAFSMFGQDKASEQNLANSKELMALQHKYGIDTMNYQAKVVPGLQKRGLEQAGYNPALMQGSTLGGVSAQQPSATMQSAQNPLSGLVEGLTSALVNATSAEKNRATLPLLGAQTQQTQTQTEQTKSQTELTRAQTANQWFVNDILNPLLEEKERGIIDLNDAQTQKTLQEKEVLSKEFEEIQQKIENLKTSKSLDEKQIDFLDTEIKKYLKDIELLAEEIKTEKTAQDLNRANTAAAFASAYSNRMQGQFYGTQISNNKYEASRLSWNAIEAKFRARSQKFDFDVKNNLGIGYFSSREVVHDVVDVASDVVDMRNDIHNSNVREAIEYENAKSNRMNAVSNRMRAKRRR